MRQSLMIEDLLPGNESILFLGRPGRGVIENNHSTDVESTNETSVTARVSMSIHHERTGKRHAPISAECLFSLTPNPKP
jgi:hypothetical protein